MKNNFQTIELEKVLNSLKEQVLPKGDERALVFNLSFTLSIYGEETTIYEHLILRILFYNPTNYVKVAYSFDKDNFQQVANHDSTWREGVKRSLQAAEKFLTQRLKDSTEREGLDIDDQEPNLYISIPHRQTFFDLIQDPSIEAKDKSPNSELITNF